MAKIIEQEIDDKVLTTVLRQLRMRQMLGELTAVEIVLGKILQSSGLIPNY